MEESKDHKLAVSTQDDKSIHIVDDKTGKGQMYDFSYSCGSVDNQSVFFENCGIKALMDSVVEGYSATCFAYGQV